MTRIAIDARLLHYRHGGIPNYITHLISQFSASSGDESFFVLQHRNDNDRFTETIHHRRVSCFTPPHHQFERIALGLELLPRKIDLLHSTDFIQPLFGYRKSIITVHDLAFLKSFDHNQKESKSYYLNHIEDAVKRASHIITDSEATRIDLLDAYPIPQDKVTTIHLGIGDEFYKRSDAETASVRAKYHLPDKYLLFVGTIEPRKNISSLLTAFDSLRKADPETPKLVLVGQKGWQTEEIYLQRDRLRLNNHTQWLENITTQDLPAIYSGAELLILPSHYEGFGFPPLEAMACGTPCIVSRISSLPEIVGDAGIYCDPTSVESIISGMKQMLSDDVLRQRLIASGKERAAAFTWEKTAEMTLSLYRRILGENV